MCSSVIPLLIFASTLRVTVKACSILIGSDLVQQLLRRFALGDEIGISADGVRKLHLQQAGDRAIVREQTDTIKVAGEAGNAIIK